MILEINGNISRYYAESLVLLFFPGSKFPENPTQDCDNIKVTMSVWEHNGTASGSVCISGENDVVEASYTVPIDVACRKSGEMLCKIAVGGAMLDAGGKFTGACPPWGMLTGVRPAKMALEIINRGHTEDEAAKMLCGDFLCKASKAHLAASTASVESVYITDKARGECSVYIAIPFCPSKCSYCSFVSFTSEKLLSLIPEYLIYLCDDIKNIFELIEKVGKRVSTVYIGGGTPTVLSENQLEILLSCISNCIDVSTLDEFTLEAGRPDTITEEKLDVAKKHGVTRISVNTQTLNNNILAAIGRHHTSDDFFDAYDMAKKSGIRDINVDLIAGLPGESSESFAASLDKVIELDPTNITVHTFYAKRAAEVVKKNNEIYRIQDIETQKAVEYSQRALISAGYRPYYMYRQKNTTANLENVGYAKPGHEGIYNIMMMEEIHTVFGAGASAMTKLVAPHEDNMKIIRICETKYPYEYLDNHKSTAQEEKRDNLWEQTEDFYSKF